MAHVGQAILDEVQLEWAAITECGPHRRENQDAVLAVAGCYAVADGMGGHTGGALASTHVVTALSDVLSNGWGDVMSNGATETNVSAALDRAQRAIESAAHGVTMGSTVTGMALSREGFGVHWLVWHVGDSRLYRFYRGEMSQVTVDHTVVQELVLAGELQAADVAGHPDRHVITRAVGTDDSLPADFATLEVRAGEVLLLCSDGLSGTADDDLIESVLRTCDEPLECARRLIDLAQESGSRDNTSVIVVRCLTGPERDVDADGGVDGEATRPRPPQRLDPGPGPAELAPLPTSDSVIMEVPK